MPIGVTPFLEWDYISSQRTANALRAPVEDMNISHRCLDVIVSQGDPPICLSLGRSARLASTARVSLTLPPLARRDVSISPMQGESATARCTSTGDRLVHPPLRLLRRLHAPNRSVACLASHCAQPSHPPTGTPRRAINPTSTFLSCAFREQRRPTGHHIPSLLNSPFTSFRGVAEVCPLLRASNEHQSSK